MKRVFDLLNVLEDVCLKTYQSENWDSSTEYLKEDFGDMYKLVMMTKNVTASWANSNYFIVKAVSENPNADIVANARNQNNQDGLIQLCDDLTQEFEDEYADGGLKPTETWDSKEYIELIVKFLYSKNLFFKKP